MTQFATALYRCLLLREPDQSGLANAVGHLVSGHLDFESTMRSCLGSPEFRDKIPEFVRRYGSADKQTSGAGPFDYVHLLSLIKRLIQPNVYLEVGVAGGATLASDPVPEIVIGIDPKPALTADAIARLASKKFTLLTATSDDAFAELTLDDGPIDMSYIDGLHHAEVALRDIANCARLSREGALMCVHDVIPGNQQQASRTQGPGTWMGDVYKIVPIIWNHFPEIPTILINDVPPSGMFILVNTGDIYERVMGKYASLVREIDDLEYTTTVRDLKARSVGWNTQVFARFIVQAVRCREPISEFAHRILQEIRETLR
jgi:predicted O-methyltransferase YrrM